MLKRGLPFLPEDLIIELILVRIPVKSLGRFRCVSKPWLSVLSSPRFAKAHRKVYAGHKPQGSIFVSLSKGFTFCTVDLGNESRMVSRTFTVPSYHGLMNELQGSCHGLVLVKEKDCLNLLNPMTRETLKIPSYRSSSYDLGLGYDSGQDDYKIVCLPSDETTTVGIYSVKMQAWRSVGNLPYVHCEDGGLFVNGYIHWPARDVECKLVIAAFSLAREEFNELQLPSSVDCCSVCITLTVLGECLSMIVKHDHSMDIWVMKEYGIQDSWTKYTLDISVNGRLRDVGVLGKDEFVFVQGSYEELLACNWRIGGSRSLFHAGIPCLSIDGITNFRESLLSPIYR